MTENLPGKTYWIALKPEYITDGDGESGSGELVMRSVVLHPGCDSHFVQQYVRDAFNLNEDNLVLKLRNTRGCLVPINSEITPNEKSSPYILEVCNTYQHIKPIPRTLQTSNYNHTLHNKLQNLLTRVQRLEQVAPELRNIRNNNLTEEMQELERKLDFLNSRMRQADSSKWKGMFKRNPLW
ncbi:PREDICTED: uncharacterized protein LOC106807825 isoform X1 [Priapulus caudatus]|uniref:Uncharacterized protein LOC106807825 isoform X1 n=1 Tax=Priapulus caudatus TaxID=37621 RepID=A0ABM1E0Q3_PRICU|nr:PREDICTED: uncharacterized protein LOC106807825 isoform X1 [Priapulus caudatus]